MYVDDIVFEEIPECGTPVKVKVAGVEENAAYVSWKSNSYENRVRIFKTAIPDSIIDTYSKFVLDTVVRGQSAKIVGLQPATTYYAYVSAMCGEHPWSTEHCAFKTACAPLEITRENPYFENFDSYTSGSGNHADCWNSFYLGKTGDAALFPSVNASAKYGSRGNGYSWNNTSTGADSTQRATATLPQMPQDVQGMSLSFMYRSATKTATPGRLLVGIASDVSSIEDVLATQVIVDTLVFPENDNETWNQYVLPLDNATAGGGKYIVLAVYYEKGVSTAGLYVDNVQIGYSTENPDAGVNAPKFLSVPAVSFTEATVKITPADEVEGVRYQVALVDEKREGYILQLEDLTEYATLITMDTLYQLTDLQESTKYTLYARAFSGDKMSAWMGPTTFFTRKSTISAGETFRWGFERAEKLTRIGTTSNLIPVSLYTGNIAGSTTGTWPKCIINTDKLTYVLKGDYALQMSSTAVADSAYIALPVIENASDRQLSLNIRAGYTGLGYDKKGVGYDSICTIYPKARLYVGTIDVEDSITSFTPLMYFRPTELQVGDRPSKANNYLFDHVVVSLPDLTGKRLAVLMPEVATLHVDEMAIEPKAGYNTPSMPAVVPADETATMVWDKRGNEKWNVYVYNYKCDFLTAHRDSLVFFAENVADTTITITGLKENTRYYAFVQVAGYQNAY